MTTVTITHAARQAPEVLHYTYHHSAVSALLLSGFLPSDGENETFFQPFTGAKAILEITR